jgi:hypothetical protein
MNLKAIRDALPIFRIHWEVEVLGLLLALGQKYPCSSADLKVEVAEVEPVEWICAI